VDHCKRAHPNDCRAMERELIHVLWPIPASGPPSGHVFAGDIAER
jgi:hypothetical protein